MERGVRKEGDAPDPNYVHLHLEIFLPDILKSSGLGGGGLPRTQPEKANLSAEEGGKKWGKSLLDKDTWKGTLTFLPLTVICILYILASSKGLIHVSYDLRKGRLECFST